MISKHYTYAIASVSISKIYELRNKDYKAVLLLSSYIALFSVQSPRI